MSMKSITIRILISAYGGFLMAIGIGNMFIFDYTLFQRLFWAILDILLGLFLIYKARYF